MRILLISACFLILCSQRLAAEVVAIVHADSADASVSASDIKNMYLGKKSSWTDGTKVTIYTHADKTLNETFLKNNVKKTPSQFKAFWKKQVFTGKGRMPDKHADDAAMIKAIAAKKGAVGYVDKKSVEGATGIKVLSIQ